MMLIQLILIPAFIFLFLRLLSNPTSYRMQAWKKIFAFMFLLLAVFAVLLPDSLNDVAHVFGVGRGADLLLYLLVLAFMFFVFTMYVKDTHDKRRLVRLVRAMALNEAEHSPHNLKLSKNLSGKQPKNA